MSLFRVRGAVHNTANRLLNTALTKAINSDAQFPYSDAAKPVKFTAESACVFDGLSRGQRATISAVDCIGQSVTSYAGGDPISYLLPITLSELVESPSFASEADYYTVVVAVGVAGGSQDETASFFIGKDPADTTSYWSDLGTYSYFNASFAQVTLGYFTFQRNNPDTANLRISWDSVLNGVNKSPVIVATKVYKNTEVYYTYDTGLTPCAVVDIITTPPAGTHYYDENWITNVFPNTYNRYKRLSAFFGTGALAEEALAKSEVQSIVKETRASLSAVPWQLAVIEATNEEKFSYLRSTSVGVANSCWLMPRIIDNALWTDTTYGEWKSISISAPSTATFDGEAVDSGLSDLITATGEFSVAFTSSDLLLNKELRADTRTYDITAQPAIITKAYVVRADSRSYVLAGQQALIKVDRLAITEVISYTASFEPSAITAQRRKVAETGEYQLQGQNAEILLPNKVITATGSITVNGTEAAILKGYVAQAITPSYVLDGQSIEVSQSRVVQSEDAQYDVQYTPAIVAKGHLYSVDSVDYSLVFTDAVLEFNRKVRAFGGGYTLTGNPIEITVPKAVIAETSEYTVQGEAVLLAGSLLIADSANYVTGNTQAELKAGREVLAVTRDYSLVGKPALLVKRASYSIVAETTTYSLSITEVTIKAPALLRTEKAVFSVVTYVVALKVPAKIIVTDTEYNAVGNDAILQYSGLALFNMEAEQAVYLVDTPNVGLNYVKYLVCATAKYKVNKADYTLVTNTQMSEAERLARRQMGNTIRLGG